DHVGPVVLEVRQRGTAAGDHGDGVHARAVQRRPDGLREQDVIVDDQDANRWSSFLSTGSERWNVAPTSSESTQTCPPCASATRRVMNRPRPLPPAARDPAPPRTNGSKMISRSAGGTPGP